MINRFLSIGFNLKLLSIAKLIFPIFLFFSCASNSSNNISNDLQLITSQSQNNFVGIGTGNGATESIALKIARASALGELSTNIKVHIKSRLDLYESESSNGETFESFSEKIIEIGQATVKNPTFEIINTNFDQKSKKYHVKILAKKNRNEYYSESAEILNLNEVEDLLNFLSND